MEIKYILEDNNDYKTEECNNNMTICIAAICEDTNKVIVSADRMITAAHLSQEFEHNVPKMEKISNTCVAVTAGSALAPREIFSEVRKWAEKVSNHSVHEIVEEVMKNFNRLRLKKAEERHLKSRGFENANEFYLKSQSLPPQLIIPIDQKLSEERLSVEILIAGVDSDGAHIYWITDPGVSECFDLMCYSAVGSGEPHALHTFISENYNSSFSLNKALFTVYEAKKNAENAPGVGKDSDFWVIDKNGIQKLEKNAISELDNIYKRKRLIVDEGNSKIREDVEDMYLKEVSNEKTDQREEIGYVPQNI